ncbi:hypothetical protein VIAG107301_07215 [Vibrio agarivorans]
MSVVRMASQSIKNKRVSNNEMKTKVASVHSLTDRKKLIAFENAKKNMKLAADKLDW